MRSKWSRSRPTVGRGFPAGSVVAAAPDQGEELLIRSRNEDDDISDPSAPSWLSSRRQASAARVRGTAAPTEADEDWRYGRIDELDLGAFPAISQPGTGDELAGGIAAQFLEVLGETAGLVRTVDGSITEISAAADGTAIRLQRGYQQAERPECLGEVLSSSEDLFTLHADTYGSDVVVCSVPPSTQLEAPICIVHEITRAAEGSSVFPRTLIRVGEDSAVSIIEVVVCGDRPCLIVPITELSVATNARVSHHVIDYLGERCWQIGYLSSEIARDARLTSFVGAFGGHYARLRTESRLVGSGATSELLSVYLADGSGVQDIRTFQEHAAPSTTSELIFKGAVADSARSVYSGLIHIHKGARRSNASQVNRNLVLSEGAHADSVPNLDIEENDVRCSHASTVGPIDPSQRFYLESRGVPPEIAERLILLGFFDDLLSRSPEPSCAAFMRDIVMARLASRFDLEQSRKHRSE